MQTPKQLFFLNHISSEWTLIKNEKMKNESKQKKTVHYQKTSPQSFEYESER